MKSAVVTASTKGIGRAIGLSLLEKGCYVFFNYSNDDEAAKKLEEDIDSNFRNQYTIIKADLSNTEGLNYLCETVKAQSDGIDYLILNAAVTDRSSFHDISSESWNKVMDTNLNIPFFIVQKLSDSINIDGRIIFIGALMGQVPHAMSIAYGVSKAGVHFLTQSLVKAFSDSRKITVNCVTPGFVDTPWQLNKDPEQRKRIEDKIALHRFARPEEIADLCLSIIGNGYINGSVINIDGGYSYK